MPRLDDAIQFLVSCLRENRLIAEAAAYGYHIYIPNVIRSYARDIDRLADNHAIELRVRELSPAFYEAAWELCRRGILRPGVKKYNEQSTDDGSGGNGYSVTTIGRTWANQEGAAAFVPTEPSRFAEIMARFYERFGEGFHQRAQEAIKCHFATAYLACCAMCGAATESILLHVAIEKTGSEEEVLRTYRAANGRRKIENLIVGQLAEPLPSQFRNLTDLLKYWRDDASHGIASEISEFEAYEALARLLRFAHFVDDHWNNLTN
jgi:hypothetical protein